MLTRSSCGLGAALSLALGSAVVVADEVQPGFPLAVYNSTGVVTYDAASDLFAVDATPLVVRFDAVDPPRLVNATGNPATRVIEIVFEVDENGDLVGGVPGDDFSMVGEVDEDGDGVIDYDGVLLTGEILSFCFRDNPPSIARWLANVGSGLAPNAGGLSPAGPQLSVDEYDLRLQLTGGSLAPLYGTSDIGIAITSEDSDFAGDFSVGFGGGAKGAIGAIVPISLTSCCFPDGTCQDDLASTECATGGGVFVEGFNCADADCPQFFGACCLSDGTCVGPVSEDECIGGHGGVDFLAGVSCDTMTCTPGACCVQFDGCSDVTSSQCAAQAGTFLGPGTDCVNDTCALGACCYVDTGIGPNCVDFVSESECTGGFLGDYQGDGSLCGETPCPIGACCNPDGTCNAPVGKFVCESLNGGVFQGAGSVCVTDLCFTGACCIRGICSPMTETDCVDAYGTFEGAGVACVDVCCKFLITFEDEADFDWPPTPLANGQVIDDEFSVGEYDAFVWKIESTGYNNGPAIYDATLGVNDADADLQPPLTPLSPQHEGPNCLILQQKHYPQQDPPGFFAHPNDAAEGGTMDIFFNCWSKMLSVELLDVCANDDDGVTVTLYDVAGKTRTYHVPSGYTSYGDGGRAKLRLNTSSAQTSPETNVEATVVTEPGFDKLRVFKISFDWDGSGAIDNLKICLPNGICTD